jgi:hypothetical protein
VPDCTPGQYISREVWGAVGGLSTEEQRSHFALWAMMAAPMILGNDPRRMSAQTRAILLAPHVLRISQDARVSAGRRSWRGGLGNENGSESAKGEVWRRELGDGCVALLLLNGGDDVAADVEARWARDVAPPLPLPAACVDAQAGCAAWAGAGECAKNSAYMADTCAASCPTLCPAAVAAAAARAAAEKDSMPLRARVADAWSGEELGVMDAGVVAHALPPHASRLLIVKLLPEDAGEEEASKPLLPPVKRARGRRKGGAHEGSARLKRARKRHADADADADAEDVTDAAAPRGRAGGAAAAMDVAARAQALLLLAALAVLWRRYGRGGAPFWNMFSSRGPSASGRQRRASTGGIPGMPLHRRTSFTAL